MPKFLRRAVQHDYLLERRANGCACHRPPSQSSSTRSWSPSTARERETRRGMGMGGRNISFVPDVSYSCAVMVPWGRWLGTLGPGREGGRGWAGSKFFVFSCHYRGAFISCRSHVAQLMCAVLDAAPYGFLYLLEQVAGSRY